MEAMCMYGYILLSEMLAATHVPAERQFSLAVSLASFRFRFRFRFRLRFRAVSVSVSLFQVHTASLVTA